MDVREASIKEVFGDFQPRCLVDNDDIEAWNFKHPDHNYESFDIVVTKTAMTMTGDYGDIIFTVGSRYGIEFLTHPSKGYVIEKMHKNSVQRELDDNEFLECCYYAVFEYITDRDNNHPILEKLNDCKNFEQLSQFIEFCYYDDSSYDDIYEDIRRMHEFLSDAYGHRFSDIQTAHQFLYDQDFLTDTFEWNISKISPVTESRMWALHVAAEKIMEIKNGIKK